MQIRQQVIRGNKPNKHFQAKGTPFLQKFQPHSLNYEKTRKLSFANMLSRSAVALTPAPSQTTTPTSTPSTQTKKEISFSGTHYWSSTPKAFPVDPAHPDRIMAQSEIFGVRVNDSGDGPFNGASVHIVTVGFYGKDFNRERFICESWTDKDGDKVIWELTDRPSGASSSPGRLIVGTGKYTGWEGTMEFTLQFPKPSPEGTMRGICREVVKLVAPQ